jgi:hypothetical protein
MSSANLSQADTAIDVDAQHIRDAIRDAIVERRLAP